MSNRVFSVILRELREARAPFLFFLAAFGLGHFTKVLLLEEYHLTAGGVTMVIVGALIAAKAILVADLLPITNVFRDRALAYSIVWKATMYTGIALAFHFLEELIHSVRRYGGLQAGYARLLEETSWPHFWVIAMWLGFAMLLYCLAQELIRVLGPERVRVLLVGGAGDSAR